MTVALRVPEPGVLAGLRVVLVEAGYSAEPVGRAQRLYRYVRGTETAAVTESDERLAALVKLFALGERVPVASARGALAPVALEEIQGTGLLRLAGEWAIPQYLLLPHDHLFVTGDARGAGDWEVVSPFTDPSLALAGLTPRTHVSSTLDLGTGSGILSLLSAGHCQMVTAVDVNPRALAFARFNAALNGIENIELLEGSWFEPVGDRRFDLIVANPPYVVSPDREFAYRDSGLAGTELLEQLTRGMARQLEPGGIAIMLCSWPHASEEDWDAAPLAAVRDTGCDALILGERRVDPLEHAVGWNTPPVRFLGPETLRETVARWVDYYRATGAGAISFGAVILRRSTTTPWVSALPATPPGDRASEHLLRLFAGQDLLGSLDDRALLDRRFTLPDGIDISQRLQRREARFTARPAMIRLDGGLGVSASLDPDALDVLFACDGQRTLHEAVASAAGRRGTDGDGLGTIGLEAVRQLLARGLIEEPVTGRP